MSSTALCASAGHTTNRIDDIAVEILRGTKTWLIALASVLIGLSLLDLPERWSDRVSQLWFLALALQVALWANTAIGVGLRHYVASLGVGGIAVALAVQNILSDPLASLSIAVDKPFGAGDFIVLNDIVGTVELVGRKTTRIRALGGQQIVVFNTELLKNTINNYKRLMERRIVFKFGVTYDTTAEKAEEIPKIVQRIVQASDKLRFDRAHFLAFGDSSLDYEVVTSCSTPATTSTWTSCSASTCN